MMDSRKTPSKVARFANSGTHSLWSSFILLLWANNDSSNPHFSSVLLVGIGPINWINPWDMSMNGSTVGDGSPPVGLNLELGRGSGHSTKSSGFTIIQLQELRLQALIYKYMEAGLPVPYHLLFPLWKSVASSLGGLCDEVSPGHTSCKLPEIVSHQSHWSWHSTRAFSSLRSYYLWSSSIRNMIFDSAFVCFICSCPKFWDLAPCLGTIEVERIPIQSLGDVEERMERNGGVARMLLHSKSTVRGTCKEAVSVQESLWISLLNI